MHTIVGLFDSYHNVKWAVEVLENYDVDGDRISVVARDKDALEPEMAAGAGVAAGTATAGLVNLLAGPSTIAFVIPKFGPMIATGTFASTLFTTLGTTAAGRFGADSGLSGTLVALGLSKEEAEYYSEGVKQGGILVSVEGEDLQKDHQVRAILRGAGAMDITAPRQIWKNAGPTSLDEIEKSGEEGAGAYQQ